MTKTDKEANPAPCLTCRHYFITWDANNRYGCRAFGFKSSMMPCLDVQAASSLQCLKYEPKNSQ